MSEFKHKDRLGQDITIGCTVLYGSGGGRGNYAGFNPSKVIKLTEKKIRIEYASPNRSFGTSDRVVDPYDCVVIDKLLEN